MDTSLGLGAVAKISARTRLSETTEAIRRLVLDGVIPTGGRVKDHEIALALGVSRATFREAVRQLVHEGLLVHEPYKGLRVATVDDEVWLDLCEVRAALEVLGAQRVSVNLTPEMDAQLERAIDGLRTASDVAALNEAHFALHALLQHLAGNEVLEQTWAIIEKQARLVILIDYETDPELDRVATHAALIEAIRTRDPETIARAVNDHVINSAREHVRRRQALLNDGQAAAVKRGRPALQTELPASKTT
jgi:DNA-binding GntR family transcriptional regulator